MAPAAGESRADRSARPAGFTAADLAADLRGLGVRAGEVLIVHSSMKSIGRVWGGPEAVVAALLRAVGPRGTIVMPAFSYSFEKVYSPVEPYDPQTSPSQVGLIPATFRRQPGVLRSGHPTHSVAAWGALAGELTAIPGPLDEISAVWPFGQAARRGAAVLLIGCSFTALTLLHVAEELAECPYLPIFNWGHQGWKPTALMRDDRGRPVSVGYRSVPGCSRNFGVAEALVRQNDLLREGRLGDARVLRFEAQAVMDLVAAELRRNPALLLCPPGTCAACDQRHAAFEHSVPGAEELGQFMIEVVAGGGCRLAGSGGEARAAEIIARRMQRIGLCDVQTHHFPVSAWEPGFSQFQALVNGRWEEIPSAPAAHSPSTGGRTREGRTVQLESLADLDKLPDRRGAVAVLWDGCGQSLAEFRRLMNAGFLGLVAVDTRYTHDELVATGVPSRWVPDFRTPMISLPHPQAVRLFGRGPVACRLKVDGRVVPGHSTVVTGEIPGTQPGVILLSGHHDTTFNSAAPDDNLSGVATVLQVATLLLRSKLRPRWTLRFCSFGAEEQLSEGARWYAFESGLAGPVRLVLNTDSGGSRCGTTGVYVTGDAELTGWLRRQARRSPLQLKIIEELCPFSDQFPFNCQGVPSLWFYRRTTAAGRHYHHTIRDTLAEISMDQLARLAEFQAALVRRLSRRAQWPFRRRLPPQLKKEVAAARKRWFG